MVEIPGYVDGNGLSMPVVGELPRVCAATCSVSARVQQMGVEAAVRGDVLLLKLAMLHDPFVDAVCNPEEVWQMTDEMLIAHSQWLPQYAADKDAAKMRLAKAERTGTRVNLNETASAARIHTKSLQEMANTKDESRKNAAVADKGKMSLASASN